MKRQKLSDLSDNYRSTNVTNFNLDVCAGSLLPRIYPSWTVQRSCFVSSILELCRERVTGFCSISFLKNATIAPWFYQDRDL